MGRSQRLKGMAAEREACSELSRLLERPVERQLNQTRDGGADIDLGQVLIEVKRQENARLHTWMSQAEDAASGTDKLPAVMWRPSRRGWLVCMALEDWAQLMRVSEADISVDTIGESERRTPTESVRCGGHRVRVGFT